MTAYDEFAIRAIKISASGSIISAGHYTRIFTEVGQAELAGMNLGIIYERMPAGRFVRLSRSLIVNRSHIYRVGRKKRTCKSRRERVAVTPEISKSFLKELEAG